MNEIVRFLARLARRAPKVVAASAMRRPTDGTSEQSFAGRRGLAQWFSIPLATAGLASLTLALLAMNMIATSRSATIEVDAAPALKSSDETSIVPVLPEPAAGPDTETEPDAAAPEQQHSTSLPEIPEAPPSLDDVARELQRRRQEILELEASLALREAAVRAAEADLVAELERLESFQRALEDLVGQADAEEEERLAQLVKMYESMRAKSAAAIFNGLEMPVIVAVAQRMREAKMAAILAAMDPDRARLVTIELAREQTLPELE